MSDEGFTPERKTHLRLRVAGLTLSLTSSHPTGLLDPRPAFRPFLVARGGDLRLSLSEDPVPAVSRGDLVFDSGGVWRVYRHEGQLLYTFRTALLTPPVYKAVLVDDAYRKGVLHFPRPRRGRRPRYALDFPLDNLLFQHRLARDGAAEVHACGVIVRGCAVLFCGQSGAGKSTTARLWARHRPGTPILSDDRIVLRARRGPGGRGVPLVAHGTPWHGEGRFARAASAPLGALFFLRHGRGNRIRPLAPADAAARLFARTFPPVWDGDAVAKVLDVCTQAVASVPCAELTFRPDKTAVETALGALTRT